MVAVALGLLAAGSEGDSVAIIEFRGGDMPNLIDNGFWHISDKALKKRTGRHGISVEAEHRKILTQALSKIRKRSFAEAITACLRWERIPTSNRCKTKQSRQGAGLLVGISEIVRLQERTLTFLVNFLSACSDFLWVN